ncbi:MAG TPA: choice-of-anchor tandem repeat GloVer-containing protein [Terriglobales bacterium]|jgi:uncharacterized repeat protein (TIGR03803 family)|nr:choice-of-anchor tandem repeat GloVer-containing protein [Terriglobales bacterium]
MKDGRYLLTQILALAAAIVLAPAIASVDAAGTYKILYSFGPRNSHGCYGESPYAGLTIDTLGNLYGVTSSSSSYCAPGGTAFKLSPTSSGGWKERTLHLFGSQKDGSTPVGSMVLDPAGNLYGTTAGGFGTVFELILKNKWNESILHNFTGNNDGDSPVSSLAWDSKGNLYGTTLSGGINNCDQVSQGGCGTVFELTQGSDGSWNEKVLYEFTGGKDGSNPRSGVVLDSVGNIYGTAGFGGSDICGYPNIGCGTAFELEPNPDGSWKFKVLHEFSLKGDGGAGPWGTLTMDNTGNLFGTAAGGGHYGPGVVFEFEHTATGWKERVLHAFTGGNDGANPFFEKLVFDSAGNIYGTTEAGGTHGNGVAFELTTRTGGGWPERVLHNFGKSRSSDGANPYAGVVLDAAGHLYGTTLNGGRFGYGTVFEIVP